MIRAILISSILILSYIYLSDTLKVKLKYKNNMSTIEINCYGKYDKKESLANLSITKDGKQFYRYDNRTRLVTLTPVLGIPSNSIKLLSPGSFVMTGINKTTSGYYNCTIFSNKARKYDRTYIQVNDINFAPKNFAQAKNTLKVKLIHNPYKKNVSTIELSCFGQYDTGDGLANLTITKDGKEFYRYDNRTGLVYLTPVHGIPSNSIQLLKPPGHFVMTRINKTTSGYYNCTIFSNKSRNYDRTYIQVNDINTALKVDNLKVKLTYHMKNISTIEINCYGIYDKKDALANLTITKDGKQFYRYDSRSGAVTLTPVHGIQSNSIRLGQSPGRFVMTRVNRATSGWYNCSIFSYKTRNYARTYIQVNASNILSTHLFLPIFMIIISIFK